MCPILKIYFTLKSFSQLRDQTETLLLESFRDKKGLCSAITRAKRARVCVFFFFFFESKSNDIAILVASLYAYVEQSSTAGFYERYVSPGL